MFPRPPKGGAEETAHLPIKFSPSNDGGGGSWQKKMGCSKLNFTNITTSSLAATDYRRVSVKEYIAVQEHSQFPDQYDKDLLFRA